mgnify:CR=1 FL=1
MNKDVIYIEPEDDITSIIRKLNSSEHKLVALVPPKRIGVLRSAVNTRLIAKNAKQSGKTVVIVSSDPSLTKLSAAAGIPVADTLQSRPKLPDDILDAPAKEAIPSEITIEEDKMTVGEAATNNEAAETEIKEEKPEKVRPAKNTQKIDDEVNSVELEAEAGKESDEQGEKKKTAIPDLDKYKKWFIIGGVGVVVLIGFLIWAFVFAPAAEILVSIRTTGNNFSENVSFTTEATKEDSDEGVFYLDKQTYNADNTVEFEATGEKDVGEKAKGSLTVTLTVTNKAPVTLPANTNFTRNGLNYKLDKETTYKVQDDDSTDECTIGGTLTNPVTTCTFTATLAVTAEASGEKYNVEANSAGWTVAAAPNAKISNAAISGGSSKVIKVVTQSDVDKAKTKLQETAENVGKGHLLEQFSDDTYKIETSYKVESKDPVVSPAVGEEVKDGEKPKITQTTTYSMYGVDSTKLSEFIKKKTESSIASDQKVYETGSAFLENFRENNGSYTARLKSTTQTGPSVTEEEILDKSKGRKVGEVQSLIKSINGVSSVKVNTSFFWVNSVPNDANKITIELKVEE